MLFIWFCGNKTAESFLIYYGLVTSLFILILSSNAITSLGEKGAIYCVVRLLICPRFVVLGLTTLPHGTKGGHRSLIVSLPGDLSLFSVL